MQFSVCLDDNGTNEVLEDYFLQEQKIAPSLRLQIRHHADMSINRKKINFWGKSI